jgi:PAS domain S-box-containing protein
MGVYRPRTKDRAWLLVNAEPQLADDGSVRQVICSFSDITARKQAEAALHESEERYRSFFEHSIDAILLTAPDGRIFAANPAACRIFDRTEAEICLAGRDGLLDTADPRLAVALEQRARTGMFKGELTYRRRDGTLFSGEMSTGLFRDRDGLVRTSMIIRDITDRKRAEEALHASQTLLQGIVDHAPMSIVIQDIADGRYLLVNRSLTRVTGHTVEQLLGRTLAELYPPESVALWRAQDREIARTHQAIQVEDNIRHSDGTLHTSLGIKFPIYDIKCEVYAIGGIFTDITERKRAEQERELLIEALQEALANIKTLRGMLPICASCKKIRDDSGYWSQIEAYIQAHSDAVFSHGICPDCARRMYGDIFEE